MKLYVCKVRLAGSLVNEVRKENVTAAEIEILRALHGGGPDAVVGIEEIGEVKREHRKERARLYGLYANPALVTPEQHKKTMEMIRGLFGHDSLPLPDAVEDIKLLEADETEADEPTPVAPPIRRTKVAKAETAAHLE